MREILFRGKDIAGNWHYGVPLVFTEDYVCMTAPHTYNKSVIPETVGQYTGLRDCKRTEEYPEGQMIFEGDIVKGAWNTILVIYYDDCYIQFRAKHKWGENEISYYGDTNKLEVIGNIHDNKLEDFVND